MWWIKQMKREKQRGVTLLEVLLVLAVASAILIMIINYTTQRTTQLIRDKTTIQIQQILDAALAYYNNNGTWPVPAPVSPATYNRIKLDDSPLIGTYLPSSKSFTANLLGSCDPYFYIDTDTTTGLFSVWTASCGPASDSNAKIIAGTVPSGFITASIADMVKPVPSTCTAGTPCYVIAQVNMPGQNLNNARSVNFANLYKSGQCVPYPACPATMTPQIFAAPVGVSGNNDTTNNTTMYPLISYTAYATTGTTAGQEPPFCQNQTTTTVNATCVNSTGTPPVSGGVNNRYWRVCLNVTTTRGTVTPITQDNTKNIGTILVVTRCQPGGTTPGGPVEPTGSPSFNVWN